MGVLDDQVGLSFLSVVPPIRGAFNDATRLMEGMRYRSSTMKTVGLAESPYTASSWVDGQRARLDGRAGGHEAVGPRPWPGG